MVVMTVKEILCFGNEREIQFKVCPSACHQGGARAISLAHFIAIISTLLLLVFKKKRRDYQALGGNVIRKLKRRKNTSVYQEVFEKNIK